MLQPASLPAPARRARFRSWLPVAAALLGLALGPGRLTAATSGKLPAAPGLETLGPVGQFLDAHCAECHDDATQKGKMRVDTLLPDFKSPEMARRWGRILTRIEAGEMPPPKKGRPPAGEVSALLSWTKEEFAQASRELHPEGRARLRRLNRLEYENTVHDLLGVHTSLQTLLPVDEAADGFDTSAKSLSISPVHIQRYLEAADAALAAAVVHGPQPLPVRRAFSYINEAESYFLTHPNNVKVVRPHGTTLLFFAEPHVEVPAKLNQFAEITKASPGLYHMRVATYTQDARGKSLPFKIRTVLGKETVGYYDAPPDEPGVTEFDRWFEPGDTIIVAPYRLDGVRGERGYPAFPQGPFKEPEGIALGVPWVEAKGPLNEQWPPLGHQRLFGGVPLQPLGELPAGTLTPGPLQALRGSDALTPVSRQPAADARRLLGPFLARAFRRPVDEEDLAPYLGLVQKHLQAHECFETAMLSAYRAVLCSPDFLFVVEEPGPLTDHALASRLSYFLWRTAPDDDLRAVADRGELHQPEVLRREAARLLASPRSDAFIADFLDQWLRLREMNATLPDPLLFPEFYEQIYEKRVDAFLPGAMVAETRLFFRDLLTNDAPLLQLIDSDFTYLNARLAQFYGLPAVAGSAMRRVALPPGSVRGGVLTQASVLKVTANGALTSPVLRGAFVEDAILGRPVPPPPPNIGTLEPDTRGATTVRERLAKHQQNESCAVCHRQLDPPGFALESFDPIGQWRTFYRTTETGEVIPGTYAGGFDPLPYRCRHGAEVDASGRLATGQSFAGMRDFKKLLLQQPDAITRCLASKLVTYATGNRTDLGDLQALDGIVARTREQRYGLRSLLLEVVQSELFCRK